MQDFSQLPHVKTFTSFPPTCMLFEKEKVKNTERSTNYGITSEKVVLREDSNLSSQL